MIHIQVSDSDCISPSAPNSLQRTFTMPDAVRVALLQRRKNRYNDIKIETIKGCAR